MTNLTELLDGQPILQDPKLRNQDRSYYLTSHKLIHIYTRHDGKKHGSPNVFKIREGTTLRYIVRKRKFGSEIFQPALPAFFHAEYWFSLDYMDSGIEIK